MTVFVIAYDLVKKNQRFDYEKLWKELARIGAFKIQENVWLLNAKNTAKEVCERVKSFMHADDRVWVSVVSKNSYYYVDAMQDTSNWLDDNNPA